MFQTVAELKDHIPTLKIDIIIVSDSWYESIYADLYELLPLRIQFYQLTTFWERFLESIPIYSAKESWFLENFNRGTNRGYSFIKRLMDLTVTLIFLPLVLVLAGITALLVKMSSPGPALFSQTRVGRNDQHFTIFKFRSMVVDAEKDGAQWAQERDPRITPVGRFIRATRLDEIPQLWNVLRGDMSIIGPRPERPEFVRQLAREIPHYHLRHLVRPGLTGWAQVRYRYGASTEDAAVKLTYDLYYVKNISAVLDIKIALKTVFTILGGQGR
jgi:exopolysaccharide biosynthesis polyprenyl glycosylphosphotransferase